MVVLDTLLRFLECLKKFAWNDPQVSVIKIVPALIIYLSPFDADKFIACITFTIKFSNSKYQFKTKISKIKENHIYLFSLNIYRKKK